MRRRVTVVLIILIIAVIAGVVYSMRSSSADKSFVLSGTIEATEIRLASQVGGQVKAVNVREGDTVQADESLIDIYKSIGNINEKITSPISGTILERLIEPGEIAAPGSPLLVVGDLNALTLTIYVPEDKYGQISLGQTYPVTVDSFPKLVFNGRVSQIANRAEFTPRNVQTTDSRKTTVFAVKLDLVAAGGKLKPGMPADVHFEFE
jgi:HlyD family secretion protein